MQFNYPLKLEQDDEEIFLVFPDFDEVVSSWTKEEIGSNGLQQIARDALICALQARIDFYDDIPVPSSVKGGESVYLSPMIASKLLLYTELKKRGVAKRKFASTLNLRPTDAQRLFDLQHESRTEVLSNAFATLGLEVGVNLSIVPQRNWKDFADANSR